MTVSGSNGACFAQHGALPTNFDKMATQGLTVMRLDHLVCVDRYVVTTNLVGRVTLQNDESKKLHRALGGSEGLDSLFTVDGDILTVKGTFQCLVLCSASSRFGSNATLLKIEEPIIQSLLRGNSSGGSHCLNGVLDLNENDRVRLRFSNNDYWAFGHLAFIQLTS